MGGMKGYGRGIRHYVFSHRPAGERAPGVEFVTEPIGAFATRLRAQAGKYTWMMGGAGLIGAHWRRHSPGATDAAAGSAEAALFPPLSRRCGANPLSSDAAREAALTYEPAIIGQ
jgi:hypothetical protein